MTKLNSANVVKSSFYDDDNSAAKTLLSAKISRRESDTNPERRAGDTSIFSNEAKNLLLILVAWKKQYKLK